MGKEKESQTTDGRARMRADGCCSPLTADRPEPLVRTGGGGEAGRGACSEADGVNGGREEGREQHQDEAHEEGVDGGDGDARSAEHGGCVGAVLVCGVEGAEA